MGITLAELRARMNGEVLEEAKATTVGFANKTAAKTKSIAAKTVDAGRGFLPVTTKRFEKEIQDAHTRDVRLHERMMYLYEVLGIEPESEEAVDERVAMHLEMLAQIALGNKQKDIIKKSSMKDIMAQIQSMFEDVAVLADEQEAVEVADEEPEVIPPAPKEKPAVKVKKPKAKKEEPAKKEEVKKSGRRRLSRKAPLEVDETE